MRHLPPARKSSCFQAHQHSTCSRTSSMTQLCKRCILQQRSSQVKLGMTQPVLRHNLFLGRLR
jgi:hypothetical protein